ncbi:winged helix-turn-helix transcriptional regulator [Dactylosporangium sp. NPDC000244]|uniref:winged helix-turn-helix transcriptional regulator n=1 Tax=Dactylosporangium sp. NPDC000244 TaxID=3154365 RepID=UPI00332FDD58
MLQRVHQAVDRTWGREILEILLSGPLRYTDLFVRLGEVADRPVHSRTFQATLKALIDQGLLEHRTARVPKEYALTASGRRLTHALRQIEAWDQEHPAEQSDSRDA